MIYRQARTFEENKYEVGGIRTHDPISVSYTVLSTKPLHQTITNPTNSTFVFFDRARWKTLLIRAKRDSSLHLGLAI